MVDYMGYFRDCLSKALFGLIGAVGAAWVVLAIVAAIAALGGPITEGAVVAAALVVAAVILIAGVLVSVIACWHYARNQADADALSDTGGASGATGTGTTSGATAPLCIPCAVFDITWIRTGLVGGIVAALGLWK